MTLQRLANEIERVLEQNVNDMEEYFGEWIEWDDEYGDKDENDTSKPIPEGMYLNITLDVVGDPNVEEGRITFSIEGTFSLHSPEEKPS
jgi:hypothetical protein